MTVHGILEYSSVVSSNAPATSMQLTKVSAELKFVLTIICYHGDQAVVIVISYHHWSIPFVTHMWVCWSIFFVQWPTKSYSYGLGVATM